MSSGEERATQLVNDNIYLSNKLRASESYTKCEHSNRVHMCMYHAHETRACRMERFANSLAVKRRNSPQPESLLLVTTKLAAWNM